MQVDSHNVSNLLGRRAQQHQAWRSDGLIIILSHPPAGWEPFTSPRLIIDLPHQRRQAAPPNSAKPKRQISDGAADVQGKVAASSGWNKVFLFAPRVFPPFLAALIRRQKINNPSSICHRSLRGKSLMAWLKVITLLEFSPLMLERDSLPSAAQSLPTERQGVRGWGREKKKSKYSPQRKYLSQPSGRN